MLPFRALTRFTVLLIVVSQASCVYSENPLAEPEKCTPDERLVGMWKGIDRDEITYVFIGRPAEVKNRPDGLMVIHCASFKTKLDLDWDQAPAYVFPVKLGAIDYLQCVTLPERKQIDTWNPASAKAFQFLKYQVADGRLTVWFMNRDAAKKAVEDGVLKGTVKQSSSLASPQVTLTEPSEGLRRYFASDRGASLFPDKAKLALERVK